MPFLLKTRFSLIVIITLLTANVIKADPAEQPEAIFDLNAKQVIPDGPETKYVYCRLKFAMDAKRDGKDFWVAEKAGKKPCPAAPAILADRKLSRYIVRTIAKSFEGE